MNDIERIRVTHRLSDHTQTEKDLELLRQRDKETAEKFGVNPRLFADDILFALTKVASEADILSNRHPSEPEKEEEKEPTPEPEKEEEKEPAPEPEKEEEKEPAPEPEKEEEIAAAPEPEKEEEIAAAPEPEKREAKKKPSQKSKSTQK